ILQEALDDLDDGIGDGEEQPLLGYFVRVRPRKNIEMSSSGLGAIAAGEPKLVMSGRNGTPENSASKGMAAAAASAAGLIGIDESPEEGPTLTPAGAVGTGAVAGTNEGIYLSDGKLNSGYLTQSAELLFKAGDFALARNIYKAM